MLLVVVVFLFSFLLVDMLTVGCVVASRSKRCARGWVCHLPTDRRPVCRANFCATPIRYPSLRQEKWSEVCIQNTQQWISTANSGDVI